MVNRGQEVHCEAYIEGAHCKIDSQECITPLLKSLDDEGPAPLLALDQTCIICEKYITDSTDRSHNAKWDDMHIQQNIL
jgi:hypothetical protein